MCSFTCRRAGLPVCLSCGVILCLKCETSLLKHTDRVRWEEEAPGTPMCLELEGCVLITGASQRGQDGAAWGPLMVPEQ